ncbi:MAG TPA: enoyl-CoA hydratase-related protein [Ignavibacteriaceae bacterium]
MNNPKNILIEHSGQTLIITINRPEKLNALNVLTLQELRDSIQSAYEDESIKGVIITGSGEKAFVAGADISEIADLNEVNGRKFSESGQEIFDLIENSPKPIIALVNGFALGGGCELALACHIRVATKSAIFGLPEVSLGIIPGYGGTQRLTHHISKGKAMEMILSGKKVSAAEAFQMGLATYLSEDKIEAKNKCDEILVGIYNNAPIAISMAIECINAAYSSEKDGFLMEANSFAHCCTTSDFEEGTAAFLEKRRPQFKGK